MKKKGCVEVNFTNNFLYYIRWKQSYTDWQEYVDRIMDLGLELSEYKEANQLIEKVKNYG